MSFWEFYYLHVMSLVMDVILLTLLTYSVWRYWLWRKAKRKKNK